MAKSSPPVQWRVLLEDDQWNAQAPSLPLEEEQGLGPRPHWLRRWPWILGGLALAALLLVGGVWLWARQELAVVQQGVEAALAQEAAARGQADPVELAATLDWNSDPAWQSFRLAQMQAEPAPSQAQVLQVDVQDDRALVLLRFTAPDGPTPWQAARVYRQTAEGWLHTQPTLDFWGDRQTLETGRFIFHYYGRDAAAVQGAAGLLEEEYTRLRAVLGWKP